MLEIFVNIIMYKGKARQGPGLGHRITMFILNLVTLGSAVCEYYLYKHEHDDLRATRSI